MIRAHVTRAWHWRGHTYRQDLTEAYRHTLPWHTDIRYCGIHCYTCPYSSCDACIDAQRVNSSLILSLLFLLCASILNFYLLWVGRCLLTFWWYWPSSFFWIIISVASIHCSSIIPICVAQLVMERISITRIFWFLVVSASSRLVTVALYMPTCLPEGLDAVLSFIYIQYLS